MGLGLFSRSGLGFLMNRQQHPPTHLRGTGRGLLSVVGGRKEEEIKCSSGLNFFIL